MPNESGIAAHEDDGAVYTILEWCIAAKISQGMYFKQRKAGLAPRVARAGRRVVVIESPREYFSRIAAVKETAA